MKPLRSDDTRAYLLDGYQDSPVIGYCLPMFRGFRVVAHVGGTVAMIGPSTDPKYPVRGVLMVHGQITEVIDADGPLAFRLIYSDFRLTIRAFRASLTRGQA